MLLSSTLKQQIQKHQKEVQIHIESIFILIIFVAILSGQTKAV